MLTRACSNTTENLPDSSQVKQLHADIQKVQAQLQQLLLTQPEHPIQQYISASGAIAEAPRFAADAETLTPEAAKSAALDQDLDSVRLFESFSDWVGSLSAKDDRLEVPTLDPSPSGTSLATEDAYLDRNTKVQFCVQNLENSALGEPEVVELSVTDCLQKAIDDLDENGTKLHAILVVAR